MEKETECPVAATARILGKRWTLEIIHNLRQRQRYCQLRARLGEISPTLLSQRLKFLEREGLIRRVEFARVPRHVEYELTEKGRDLLPILDALATWAKRWQLVHDQAPSLEHSESAPTYQK